MWCANLGEHKRPEAFIELAKNMQNSTYKFVMIGGHANQNYVKDLFKNAPKNLHYKGKQTFEKSLAFFDNSSVFVNTSYSEGEGFSNSIIQAWFRGIPCFVLGADPNDIISKNNLGFNCRTLQEMQSKIEMILENKSIFTKISNNAKNYARQNHSISMMTDNFLKHLEK